MVREIKQGRCFKKQFKKLSSKLQRKTVQQLMLFAKDKTDKQLNNHKLKGKYKGACSINITGDYRAIYEEIEDDVYIFITIGTHSELYGK